MLKSGCAIEGTCFQLEMVEGVPFCMMKMPTGVYPYYLD